ncbi:MAG: UDP-N-acetylmuramoyl-tripeptide--D-alanyl-D-alanine ligase [Opitutia bacterium]|jgi:UDP-N-acetylmuramoyl-tripeptide--D-alanyl-D-alanine ligase
MPVFDPLELAAWSEGSWLAAPPRRVTGFSNDTRLLRAGDAFVALPTSRRDGHDFLADARARGAACALVSRPVDDPLPQLRVDATLPALGRVASAWRDRLRFPVLGITGSVGKTSSKEMLRAVLGPRCHATAANLNNVLGVPLSLLAADPELHDAAVIEVGMSEPGELGASAAVVRPDLAIVTAVRAVHLAGVGSLAGIAREKAELVRHLAPGGEAYVPAELLAHAPFAALAPRLVALAGPREDPAVAPRRVARLSLAPDGAGWRAEVADPALGEIALALGPLSEGQARNAALVALAARRAGIPAAAVASALATWSPLPGRGSVHLDAGREIHVDCYNASPASLADAAAAFARRTRGPRLLVIGGMAELGVDSRRLHAEAGAALPLGPGDRVLAFGGDADALAAACGGQVAPDLAAVAAAIAAHPGPVLVKGSRAHALERALPVAVRSAVSFH